MSGDAHDALQALRTSSTNLADLATYVHSTLAAQANDEAFKTAKQYAIDALASVAFQVHSAAQNLTMMMEKQSQDIEDYTIRVNTVHERVKMCNARGGRKEFSKFAPPKRDASIARLQKLSTQQVPRSAPLQGQNYVRRRINYGELDGIGAGGVKSAEYDVIEQRRHMKEVPPAARQRLESGVGEIYGSVPIRSGAPPPLAAKPPTAPRAPTAPVAPVAPVAPMAPVAPVAPHAPAAPMGHHPPPPPPPAPAVFSPPPPPPAEESHYGTVEPIPQDDALYGSAQEAEESIYGAPQAAPPPAAPAAPPGTICTVRAVYDYNATQGDELTFVEGDVIYIHAKNEDGWFEGSLQATGVRGLFPGNYVEDI